MPPNKLMPAVQAAAVVTIILGFFGILILLFFRDLSPASKEMAGSMIEVLKNVLLIVSGFMFGTSASSQRKDEIIGASAPALPPVAPSAPAADPVAPPAPQP